MKRTKKIKSTLKRTKPDDKEFKIMLEVVRICIDEYCPWHRRGAKELAIKTYNELKNKNDVDRKRTIKKEKRD